MDNKKYKGIFPAFFACYDNEGNINSKAVENMTEYLIEKGVQGVYVGGSSGECIYQSVEERKQVLEHVMKCAKGQITVIAHVACNNTKDSCELAHHAESVGVDAIAAIPPIYFHLPDYAIEEYWNDISSAAPNTDFIIYNIPQLAGVSLSKSLLKNMMKNPKLKGVKNSSMPTMDIQIFKTIGGDDFVVFNGPDEQILSGLSIGADGGIGATYSVMPELYLGIYNAYNSGDISRALELQNKVNEIIFTMFECSGNLYAVMKEILRKRAGIDAGGVRKPLFNIVDTDMEYINKCINLINEAIKTL